MVLKDEHVLKVDKLYTEIDEQHSEIENLILKL